MDILAVNKAPISPDNLIKLAFCYEGRDKISKALQYGSRALAWHLLTSDKNSELGKRFQNLFKAAQDSRKVCRLGQGFKEYHKAVQVHSSNTMNSKDQLLALIKHIGMAGYLTCDNMTFLTKAKIMEFDAETLAKRGGTLWFIANLAGVCIAHKTLNEDMQKERKLCLAKTSLHMEDQNEKIELQIARLRKERLKKVLNIVKAWCDLIVSSNTKGVRVAERIHGKPLNDGIIGVSGFISALIFLFNTWPDSSNPLETEKKKTA